MWPLISRRGCLVGFTRLREFLFGCGPLPCLLSICSWELNFLKVHSSTPSIFYFAILLAIFAQYSMGVRRSCFASYSLKSLTHFLVASFVFPGIHSVSFFSLVWCTGVSAQSLMGVLWDASFGVLGFLQQAWLAHSGHSLERFLYSLLIGEILFSSRYLWPHEPLGPVLLVWYRVCLLSLVVLCSLKDWLVLSWIFHNSAWLVFPDIPIGILYNRHISTVGLKSFQNPILLLF